MIVLKGLLESDFQKCFQSWHMLECMYKVEGDCTVRRVVTIIIFTSVCFLIARLHRVLPEHHPAHCCYSVVSLFLHVHF
jgi:hypothetical protein